MPHTINNIMLEIGSNKKDQLTSNNSVEIHGEKKTTQLEPKITVS
jgi:actin-like ATPase involved in cell morphogenesis